MMTRRTIEAAALLLLATGAASGSAAQTGATMGTMPMPGDKVAACPATPAPLPPGLAGWSAMTPLAAGTDAGAAPALPLGVGARVTLTDGGAVRFAVAPGHAPAPGSHGGLLAIAVPAAGRYRVALDAGAWIDMVRGDAALPSVAHGRGPACLPVRKMVDFDLRPGRYLLQLSGNAEPALGVMIARTPA